MAKLVIILLLVPIICQANLTEILETLIIHFNAPEPLPIYYNASKESKTILAKSMNKHGLSLHWVNTMLYSGKFLFVLYNDVDIDSENIMINQQIYFLTLSMELYEKYVVNGHIVKQKLGYISNGS